MTGQGAGLKGHTDKMILLDVLKGFIHEAKNVGPARNINNGLLIGKKSAQAPLGYSSQIRASRRDVQNTVFLPLGPASTRCRARFKLESAARNN